MKKNMVPDYILEKYLFKELPRDQLAQIEKSLKNNPHTKQKLLELEVSNREILARYPVPVMAQRIRKAQQREEQHKLTRELFKSLRLVKVTLPLGALAVAALLFLVFGPLNFEKNGNIYQNQYGDFRIKGYEKTLLIYRKTGNGIELLKNGDPAGKNDLLQLAYQINEISFGVLFSIDGRSSVTLQYPESSSASTRLVPFRKTFLPTSYELDDAPGFERFFLVLSKAEINVNQILFKVKEIAKNSSVENLDNLQLGEEYKEISVVLIKKDK